MIGSVTQVQQQMADIEKRRRGKIRARAILEGPAGAAADAHEAAEGQRAVMEAESARKAFEQRGISDGPAYPVESSGRLEPGSVDRAYLEAGHAAESPQAGLPTPNPMPAMPHYVLPDQPMAAAIPQHVISQFTMGSPSDRGR